MSRERGNSDTPSTIRGAIGIRPWCGRRRTRVSRTRGAPGCECGGTGPGARAIPFTPPGLRRGGPLPAPRNAKRRRDNLMPRRRVWAISNSIKGRLYQASRTAPCLRRSLLAQARGNPCPASPAIRRPRLRATQRRQSISPRFRLPRPYP